MARSQRLNRLLRSFRKKRLRKLAQLGMPPTPEPQSRLQRNLFHQGSIPRAHDTSSRLTHTSGILKPGRRASHITVMFAQFADSTLPAFMALSVKVSFMF